MGINDFFKEIEESTEAEPLKMTTTEFVAKTRTFVSAVANLYWTNWEWRGLSGNEYDERDCDNCHGQCTIKHWDDEWDVIPDREAGECYARIFNSANYAFEMGELIEKMDYIELLDTQTELTNQPLI